MDAFYNPNSKEWHLTPDTCQKAIFGSVEILKREI